MRTFLKCFLAALSLYMATAFADLGWSPPEKFEQLKMEAEAAGCKPVYYRKAFIPIVEYVSGPGRHCVIHDFVQRNIYSLDDGRNRGNPGSDGILVFHQTSNATLDLGEHLISGSPFENMIGITAYGMGFFLSKEGQHSMLTLKNGRIETPGSWSAGVRLAPFTYSPVKRPKMDRLPSEYEDRAPTYSGKWLPPDKRTDQNKTFESIIWNYLPETHYTLDTLQIESGGRGVILSGAYNAVRNSTVEVDSKVAMVSYGPNLVIENNTFIIHGGEDVYTAPETQAILKLRDADNAVIRNNRFIAKGLFVSCSAAINLINSRNVQIENNTVEGCDSLVRKDNASSTVERGNRMK